MTGPNAVGVTYLGLGRSPTSLNSKGQVVGWNWLYTNQKFTELTDLPAVKSAGWTYLRVFAINDRGQIVGQGELNGKRRAFVLKPR